MPPNPAPTITIPGMSGRYLSGVRGYPQGPAADRFRRPGRPLPSAADRARPHRLAPGSGSQPPLTTAGRRVREHATALRNPSPERTGTMTPIIPDQQSLGAAAE